MLDQGAAGVMLPRLDSAEEVAAAIRHLRYPPEEIAVWPPTTEHAASASTRAALDSANSEVLAVVQIESARAVEQVTEIAALDGVDVLFVGPRDLSHDLGVPGDVQAAELPGSSRPGAQRGGTVRQKLRAARAKQGGSGPRSVRRVGPSWRSAPTPPCWPPPSPRSSAASGRMRAEPSRSDVLLSKGSGHIIDRRLHDQHGAPT